MISAVFTYIVYWNLFNLSDDFASHDYQRSLKFGKSLNIFSQNNIKRVGDIFSSDLITKGKELLIKDSAPIKLMMEENSYSSLQSFLVENFKNDPDIIMASFFTVQNKLIQAWQYVSLEFPSGLPLPISYNIKSSAWEHQSKDGIELISDPNVIELIKSNKATVKKSTFQYNDKDGKVHKVDILDCIIPIYDGLKEKTFYNTFNDDELTGYLRYHLSLDKMNKLIDEEKNNFNNLFRQLELDEKFYNKEIEDIRKRSLGRVFRIILLFLVILMSISTFWLIIFSSKITTPLAKLMEITSSFQIGNYQRKINIDSNDEIGLLANSFEKMGSAIYERDKEIMKINTGLEEKVKERTAELNVKMEELKESLDKITKMKNQMIMQEKLASLGILVAGIAHEIKNPLNMIINFSSISKDALDEMKNNLVETNKLEKTLDISENLNTISSFIEKVMVHGDRVNTIVKNMLTLSRDDGPIIKSNIDLNKLISEYSNFSYHGMRVKYPNLKIKFVRNLYSGKLITNVVSKELGQAFLNIFNNSVDAINEKASQIKNEYNPEILIHTQKEKNDAIVIIRDNGVGVSEESIKKIFNPFFTTKDPGLGTGLGLSISYDIITQLHQGRMEANSKVGEYTEFIIKIPCEPF